MKKLSVSELLQLADLISDLPVEERFDEDELWELIEAGVIKKVRRKKVLQ